MEADDARRLWPKTGATRRAKSHEETARWPGVYILSKK